MVGKSSRALLAFVAVVLAVPGAAALHLRLVKSTPRDGEVVTTVPTEIRLWFSQKPEVGLTSIKLMREDSTTVDVGKVVRADDTLSVKVPLEKALVPGTYIVSWRTVSRDGHRVRGLYHFNMVPGPPARKQTSGN
jgi:methionine-rich copper-binding protein CopC